MLRRLALLFAIVCVLPCAAATRYFTEHAQERVKWLAWNDATLERARKEQRPIFVSIGYAASWDGFVMHRDAFGAATTAQMLNGEYIPVLVDSIEQPELAEALGSLVSARVPVNIILTPSLEPVAYFRNASPADTQSLLATHANAWAKDRAGVSARAHAEALKVRAAIEPRSPFAVDATTTEAAVDDIGRAYDHNNRTLATSAIPFLFRYTARVKQEVLRTLAFDTLRNLAASPARDQLGGGFFACNSCFDKLLHDQALMAMLYTEAWQLSRDAVFAHVARTTLDYAIRDLREPKPGAFQASQDAYSLVPGVGKPEIVNGAFYMFGKDEIVRLTGNEAASKIFRAYHLENGVPLLAETRGLAETFNEIAEPLAKVLDSRQKRPAPFREPLLVANWNGLMISALARAGVVFGEQRYVDAATLAATSLTAKLWNAQTKTLLHSSTRVEATADDYAMLVQGLLDVFEATSDAKWFDLATTLQRRQDELFWDPSAGRYRTGTSLPEVLRGLLSESDEELPAANSIAATNLLRLAAWTADPAWRERPSMIFASFGGRLRNAGARYAQLAAAYEMSLLTPRLAVVTADPRRKEAYETLHALRESWAPMRTVLFLPTKGAARDRMLKSLPYLAAAEPGDEEHPVMTYECANGACRRQ
ncbi:MAG: DUF255 domain-containing protein [Acidobacteriota bacterium]|nr:DUF255 domain-containing protein [Acidobacteriota bacterium]